MDGIKDAKGTSLELGDLCDSEQKLRIGRFELILCRGIGVENSRLKLHSHMRFMLIQTVLLINLFFRNS